jgi:hypothetical protein
MGINVQWDNSEQTVIRFVYNGSWNMSDLFEALQDSRDLMDTVDYTVAHIVDLRESKLMPNGALSLGRNVTMRKHPRQGKTVIIGASGFVKTLYDVFRKVYRASFDDSAYTFATSLDEARLQLGKNLVAQN